MREPKAKNTHRCSPKFWKAMDEYERHLFNKSLNYSIYHKEYFTESDIPDWERLCKRMAMVFIMTKKRGDEATYV